MGRGAGEVAVGRLRDDPGAEVGDPRWGDSDPRLVRRIRDEILAAPGQRITFARYMQLALTEPGLGYYASSTLRPTRAGDFLTAPELHPFFGRCLGRLLTEAWQALGSPGDFVVREHGAGRGTLRDTVLEGVAADRSALAGALQWQALDVPGRGDAPTDPQAVDVVLANEYLDALPVHRVVQPERLEEVFVGWQDGWFREVVGAPSTPALGEHLAAVRVSLAAGQRAEICLAAPAWITDVARSARLVLVIDYAHPATELYGPRRMAGSLLTYRGHRVGDDPYAAVGKTDITAHVDLTAVGDAAAAAGLVPVASTTQARLLVALGLGELLDELGRDRGTDLPTYLAARGAVARLLDPQHLGGFRVLAWAQPGSPLLDHPLSGLLTDAT